MAPHWDDPGSCTDVVIASGENYPDGLIAGQYEERILLVKQNSVPAATVMALNYLLELSEPGCDDVDVIVVGGPATISNEVIGILETHTHVSSTTGDTLRLDEVERIWGADRYATAIAVALDEHGGGESDIVMATGENFPDALAAGSLAAEEGYPAILNPSDSLHPAVVAYLASQAAGADIHIVGGTAAISSSVDAELIALGFNVIRYAGADRFETAALVSDVTAGTSSNSIVLVNGYGWADALSAGVFATLDAVEGSLLLVKEDSIPAATAARHVARCSTLGDDTGENIDIDPDTVGDEDIFGQIFAVGGTSVISDDVLANAGAASQCGNPIDLASVTVALSGIVEQSCVVYDGDNTGGWDDDTGPTMVPVAGGLADGFTPSITYLTFTGSTDAGDTIPPSAEFDGAGGIAVELGETVVGMSQADFVSIVNGIPEVAAHFTAVAYAPPAGPLLPAPPPPAADANIEATTSCTTPTTDVTVVVTFNQNVGDSADLDVAPGAGDLNDFDSLPEGATPLYGAAIVGGSSVYTFTWQDETALPIEVGDTYNLGIAAVSGALGTNAAALDVTVTAG
jgi:putative cell wall-binding protein